MSNRKTNTAEFFECEVCGDDRTPNVCHTCRLNALDARDFGPLTERLATLRGQLHSAMEEAVRSAGQIDDLNYEEFEAACVSLDRRRAKVKALHGRTELAADALCNRLTDLLSLNLEPDREMRLVCALEQASSYASKRVARVSSDLVKQLHRRRNQQTRLPSLTEILEEGEVLPDALGSSRVTVTR